MVLKDPKYTVKVPDDYYVTLVYQRSNTVYAVIGVTYRNRVYYMDKKSEEVKCIKIPSDGAVLAISQNDSTYNKSYYTYLAKRARELSWANRVRQSLVGKKLSSR